MAPTTQVKSLSKVPIRIQLKNYCRCLQKMSFQMSPDAQLRNIANSYAAANGFHPHQLQFFFKGNRLNLNKTPNEMNMTNGSVVRVLHDPNLAYADVASAFIRRAIFYKLLK